MVQALYQRFDPAFVERYLQFARAHEYAHISVGHLAPTQSIRVARQRELDADRHAAMALVATNAQAVQPFLWYEETVVGQAEDATRPPGWVRARALRAALGW